MLALLAAPTATATYAESAFVTGAGTPLTATARLDFIVTIPRVLYLRVGTGADYTSVGTVDLITFAVPAASVGSGVPVTGVGGNLGAGAVTVRVMGNGGPVSLNSTTNGPLHNGVVSEQISWNSISVASAPLATTTAGFANSGIAHPTFNPTGGAGSAVLLTATNKLVLQEGQWTYRYTNTTPVAAGTYGGVNVNNGRVSYTASMP